MKICKVEGCDNSASYKQHGAKGYCSRHIKQMHRYRKILKRTRFDKNEIIDCGNYYEICLYSGRGEQKEIARTMIDENDLGKVKEYKWCLSKHGYVETKTKGRALKLHQLILGKIKGLDIDHRDTNPLNNRKENLRHCTHQQNCFNKKNVKGITWVKERKKWLAQICVNYKNINLGYFKKEQDAILARKKGEKKYFKEFTYNS